MSDAQEIARTAFANIDTMDAATAVSSMADDVTFIFADQPPVVGRANVENAQADFFASIGGIRHEVLKIFENEDAIITEVDVHYTRKDGSELSCHAATIWRMQGDKIAEYRIFMDVSPLFAPQR